MADNTSLVLPSDVSPRKRWEMEIKSAEKENHTFWQRGEKAIKRYIDERDTMFADSKWFNIYYANTNILESALYAQVPKPSVARKYTDYQDQVARVAALVLERCLEQDLNDPADQFDPTMRQAVQDRLVPGLGIAWLRLETDTEDIPESEGGTVTNDTQSTEPGPSGSNDGFTVLAPEQASTPTEPDPVGAVVPLKRINDQRVAVDYVHWRDFLWSPCRVWSERRWTARKVYMDREQLTARFGEKGKLCNLNYTTMATAADNRTADDSTPKNYVIQKAIVYEIWDRTTRKVIWYSDGYPNELLDEKDDFLKLSSFEPCPTPMFANITTSNVTPRPDYYMIQDQYQELDTVNARISLLVQACKVVGVYNQSAKGVQDMLKGNENMMVPVENWGQFTEKGGMEGNVDWLPLEQIVAALQRLYEAREAIKGQIYELTGIADIVRGASKASETLGAQQIKAQFASVRIKKLQDEVARFASDILRIKAEIMVKHFEPELLIRKSGITFTDNDQYVPEAIALLKSEAGFKWRVEVQADSLAQADYASEKADRIEFMSAVTGYMAQALPMAMQMPEMKPVLLGLLKWGIAGFKKGSDIEGMIDKQIAQLEGKPPAPPPPDPKIQAAQMKAQADEKKMQMDMQKQQQEMANDEKRMQMEMVQQQQELEFKKQMAQLEMEIKQAELRFKMAEHQQNLQTKMQESQMQMETQQMVNQQKVQDSMIQTDLKREQGEQQLELSAKQGEQQLEQGEAAGKQKLKLDKQAAAQKNDAAKDKKGGE